MYGWVKRYREKGEMLPFPGSGKLSPEDEQVRRLKRENRNLREENEILKKAATYLPEVKRFEFIKANCRNYRMAKLCEILEVSRSGYYAWDKRPESNRTLENKKVLIKIKEIHSRSRRAYGSRKITEQLRRDGMCVNHKRVVRLMGKAGICFRLAKKYKATTDSKHSLPVAKNILNREFVADRPNQKLVSDITYLWTNEGWLYIAALMDLYGQKIVGLAMGERTTKELVINALKSYRLRTGRISGALVHSDQGSQYFSHEYQTLLRDYGFTCSISRKGNCWDNAPMEAFWGKMKYEWLNHQDFKTRDETRAGI